MIIAFCVGAAVVLILGLIALAVTPKFDTEAPQPQTPPVRRPAELTADESATWEQLVADLEADRA